MRYSKQSTSATPSPTKLQEVISSVESPLGKKRYRSVKAKSAVLEIEICAASVVGHELILRT